MKATVIFDQCREASLNMALDAIMLQSLREEEQIVLRFYTWCPPAISIGLFQEWHQVCNYPVVRRPTGGKAVLHLMDLSYAIVAPLHGFGDRVLETYYIISQGLIRGFDLLGVPADFLPAPLPSKNDPESCFVHQSGHEIGIAGRKLVGSAQARKPWGFLQHGSIMVRPIYEEIASVFNLEEKEVRDHSMALSEVIPDITVDLLANALKDGFEEALDIRFKVGQFSPQQLSEATSIASKYVVCD
jgi:lipoate-protein ligase A